MELSQYPQPIPLIVKCGLDPGQVKRIRYADSRSLTFADFKSRISAMLQLSSHKQHRIIYDDDDGEQCEIACDDTLAEAISYFMPANGQITSISMKVSVNLISTLTLSDFGGSEIDDGASDAASSYWGSYRSPSLSGSYGNSGSAGEGSSRQSNGAPFRSVEGTSSESQWRTQDSQSYRSRAGSSSRSGPQHRSNSLLSSHENDFGPARHRGPSSRALHGTEGSRRVAGRAGDYREHDGDDDDVDDDNDNEDEEEGAASYIGSFVNSAAPLSQWGSSSLAQLQHHGLHHPAYSGPPLHSMRSFHDLRQQRVSEIRSRSAEVRARAGRSPPSSYYPSHLSGSQLDSIPEPGPVSHSYHTQSQWDEMSSLSGSIEPSLPSQELAVAAASQRNEAARAQVEEMERRILQMQAILDLEKRKLHEEEQWQQDLAAATRHTTPNGPTAVPPSSRVPVDSNVEADRQGKRKATRISAPDHDSSEESEAESVQTISNFSIMPGRSTGQHKRTASNSNSRPPFSLLGTIEEPPKGFTSEDEAVLRSLQQPPKVSESASDDRNVGEDTVNADAPAATAASHEGALLTHHPVCSSCTKDVEADSLRYVCAACGPNRPHPQQPGTNDARPASQSRSSSSGSGSGSGSGKTVASARADADHHDAGAPSTTQWSSMGSPQNTRAPEQVRGRTSSTSSNSSSSSSSSSSNSSLLSSHTQISSSSSAAGAQTASALNGTGISPSEGAKAGYELCFACFQGNAAREHLQDPKFALGRLQHGQTVPAGIVTVPGPQHAFFELLWQDDTWTPIEDELPDKCTHCMREDNWTTGRYKCSACDEINLCGECFKRVDDIHPPHVFLRMPIRAALISTANRPSGSRSSSSGSGLSHISVHTGVKCAACGQQPITGTRWHCANCIGGRDFCGRCEADEQAMAAQAGIMGHGLDHLLIKIPAPIDRQVVLKLGNSLLRAQQRLTAQAERVAAAGLESPEWTESTENLQSEWDTALRLSGAHTSRQQEAMEQAWQSASTSSYSLTSGIARPAGEQRGAQCFNCQKSLQLGPRYICANCPLGQLTPGVLGLNLCHECAEISHELHDPSHFFIKIQSSRYGTGGGGAWTVLNAHAISRLRARTGDDIEAPLLPILYKDARAIATGPPLVPARVRAASSSTLRTPGARGDSIDSDEDDAHVTDSLPGPSSSTTFAQRAWPQLTSTLAMARNGLLVQKYQKNVQSAIRTWIQNTTNEFEMYRLQCSNGRGSDGANPAGAPSRFCSLGRPSRWFGSNEGTKSPAYVPINELVHPSILCDSCYECIEGTWYRCCSCKESFDLCGKCEARVEHDSRHVFAVFKQPVDMALFKSLIDHASEASGHSSAARAMLPVLLVGDDE